MPGLLFISDSEDDLNSMIWVARDHGVKYLMSMGLTLW